MSDPILPLLEWPSGIQQASVPANDNALRNEALSMPALGIANDESGPSDGDIWIVGDTPAGAFANFDEHDIALYRGGWHAWAPIEGVRLVVADVRKMFDGAEWIDDPSVTGGGGSGDVVGPASSTAGNFAVFDDTTGKLLDDGGVPGTMAFIDDAPSDGTGYVRKDGAWAAESGGGGGGGLTNWTEAANTSSPNDTVPVVSLTATNAATNVDAALLPKGTGALVAQIPDGTFANGNKRGARANDFQRSRSSGAEVASGADSGILCGVNGRATGANSSVVGGSGNRASGGNSFVGGGAGSIASNQNAAVIGSNGATASGQQAVAVGSASGTASGTSAVIIAANNATASGAQSMAHGSESNTRGIDNSRAVGASNGKQALEVPIYAQTTSATPAVLRSNASAAAATNQWAIPTGRAAILRVMVIARQSGGAGTGDCAAWSTEVLLKNISGTASIVGTPSVTAVAADSGAAAWSIAISADNTNKALQVTVTGEASKTIEWTAYVIGPEA